jgi:hypothetical protein
MAVRWGLHGERLVRTPAWDHYDPSTNEVIESWTSLPPDADRMGEDTPPPRRGFYDIRGTPEERARERFLPPTMDAMDADRVTMENTTYTPRLPPNPLRGDDMTANDALGIWDPITNYNDNSTTLHGGGIHPIAPQQTDSQLGVTGIEMGPLEMNMNVRGALLNEEQVPSIRPRVPQERTVPTQLKSTYRIEGLMGARPTTQTLQDLPRDALMVRTMEAQLARGDPRLLGQVLRQPVPQKDPALPSLSHMTHLLPPMHAQGQSLRPTPEEPVVPSIMVDHKVFASPHHRLDGLLQQKGHMQTDIITDQVFLRGTVAQGGTLPSTVIPKARMGAVTELGTLTHGEFSRYAAGGRDPTIPTSLIGHRPRTALKTETGERMAGVRYNGSGWTNGTSLGTISEKPLHDREQVPMAYMRADMDAHVLPHDRPTSLLETTKKEWRQADWTRSGVTSSTLTTGTLPRLAWGPSRYEED